MNTLSVDRKTIYPFMKLLAEKSGEIIMNHYQKGISVDIKDDLSPVTAADKEAETCIRSMIKNEYPNHGIIGEEYGSENPDAEYAWIVDPIDGTKSFISHTPLFGTLIGLLHNGKPVAGVINNPVLNQFVYGDNSNSFVNGVKINCRECRDISDAVMCTSDPLNPAKYQNKDGFEQLAKTVKVYRTWGDCFGYYLLAAGHIDIMIDPIMNPWDSLPLIPILRGAGVMVSDYKGRDPVEHADSSVAAVPGIHAEVIKILNPEE